MLSKKAFLVGLLLSRVLLAQNVVVNPTGSQNIVQPASTDFTANVFDNTVYVVPSDNWSVTATVNSGSNTIPLATCPRGLTAATILPSQTYVYLSGVGTPEAASITSTTCTQLGGAAGQIIFTAANPHGNGTTIGSASQGVQEAINASPYPADLVSAGHVAVGAVIVGPGNYIFQARVTALSPYQTLDFSGSFVTCTMADSCLVIGSTSNQNDVWGVTVKNFTGQPACNNCNFPMIEDAAQHTIFYHASVANPHPNGNGVNGFSFGSLIQVDNDQSTVIDGLDVQATSAWEHCTSTFCSVAVKGNGGGGNSGIIYLKNSQMNLNCLANGVDNLNSNTMRISDTVIETFAQFGVRSVSSYSNVPNVELDNVYEESACAGKNPLGIGQAGLIVSGGFSSVKSSVGPVGAAPVFANTGGTQYNYYIVAHSSTFGYSAPFLAGIALTNGSGNIVVTWPQFGSAGTITYDVLRTSGLANSPAPYSGVTNNCPGGATTTCGSVTTGLTVAGACSTVGTANLCTFTDNAAANTTSYTVTSPPQFWPSFGNGTGAGVFWNGSVVVTSMADYVGASPSPSGVIFDRFGDNVANSAQNPVSQVVSQLGGLVPQFFAQHCNLPYGGAWVTCLENTNGDAGQAAGATSLSSGIYNAADAAGLKGRLNFEEGLINKINGGHKITLVDSNPAKTLATPGMRPTSDANDTYIGLDNPSVAFSNGAQLAFGAPVSISYYIGNAGDNVSYLERLTGLSKTFKVPLQLGSTINQYNGLTTGGTGLAPNLGTPFNSGSLTGPESAQTIYTTAASGAGSAGNYRVCITLWPTGTGSATAIQGNAIAPSGSGTVTLPVGPALNTTSLTNGGGGCASLHVAASSAIQCSTTGSGTGTYKMSCTVEQLQ